MWLIRSIVPQIYDNTVFPSAYDAYSSFKIHETCTVYKVSCECSKGLSSEMCSARSFLVSKGVQWWQKGVIYIDSMYGDPDITKASKARVNQLWFCEVNTQQWRLVSFHYFGDPYQYLQGALHGLWKGPQYRFLGCKTAANQWGLCQSHNRVSAASFNHGQMVGEDFCGGREARLPKTCVPRHLLRPRIRRSWPRKSKRARLRPASLRLGICQCFFSSAVWDEMEVLEVGPKEFLQVFRRYEFLWNYRNECLFLFLLM